MSGPADATPSATWPGRLAILLLAVYWAALFIGTHSPVTPSVIIDNSDKFWHFSGYAGLAFLLSAAWAFTRSMRSTQYVQVWFVIALYGAFDEVTQLLVGRSSELLDWIADVAGGLTGLVAFAVVAAVYRWLFRPAAD